MDLSLPRRSISNKFPRGENVLTTPVINLGGCGDFLPPPAHHHHHQSATPTSSSFSLLQPPPELAGELRSDIVGGKPFCCSSAAASSATSLEALLEMSLLLMEIQAKYNLLNNRLTLLTQWVEGNFGVDLEQLEKVQSSTTGGRDLVVDDHPHQRALAVSVLEAKAGKQPKTSQSRLATPPVQRDTLKPPPLLTVGSGNESGGKLMKKIAKNKKVATAVDAFGSLDESDKAHKAAAAAGSERQLLKISSGSAREPPTGPVSSNKDGDSEVSAALQPRQTLGGSAGSGAAMSPRSPYICDRCGKQLKSLSSLRTHQLSHSPRRPHGCPTCGKSFRLKHHLSFHLRTHSDAERKFECRFCDRRFLARRDVLRHERTHTGERPFKCPHCPKAFNVDQHRKLHLRTHTKERPYLCDSAGCGKRFTQANSLRLHKMRAHKQNNNSNDTGGAGKIDNKGERNESGGTTAVGNSH